MKGDSLSTRLSRFLFKYRLTPQTTSARTPAEMLMGRRLKSKLDLLRPDIKATVMRKQEKQKEGHDQHAQERQLKPGNNVYVRNFSSNSSQKWLPGVIMTQRGPLSYVVELTDGRVFRRHQDHVRLRHDPGSEIISTSEFPLVSQPTVGVSPEERSLGEVSAPPGEEGQLTMDPQTPPVTPSPEPPKTPTPAVPATAPEMVRRSQRARKPPDRLIVS